MITVNFWDIEVWTFVLALTAISVAMLIANLLIRTIKPLRRALIPAPVLGGFILLAFMGIYKAAAGENPVSVEVLEILTYHCLGLGFVATALKSKDKKDKSKSSQKTIFNASLVTVSGYLIQAIVGLAVSTIFFAIMKSWPASGLLVPMGYGQGPGQAFNWGNIFSQYTTEQSIFGPFEGGATFGLSIAAMGFVAASVGGVIYLNVQRRKGNIKMVHRSDEEVEEAVGVETFTEKGEIPMTGSVDKGSIQFCLIVFVYAVSFALIYGISKLCDASGVNLLINTVKPLFWGFNFIFGTLMASLFKIIYGKVEKKGWIKKKHTNNYLLDRFSGLFFDVMVVAAIGAIDLSAFKNREFVWPLIVMSIVAGVVTYYYVKHVCNKLCKGYQEEAFLAMFGMLCGTASTGVILLREIDPHYKTPACTDMVYQPAYSILLGAPMLLSMGMAASNWTMLWVWFAAYIVMMAIMYTLIRRDDITRWRKRKKGIEVPDDVPWTPDAVTPETASTEVNESENSN